MSTPILIITRGLPASGKTHQARRWVEADPARRARVNRDDLRTMLHGRRLGTPAQEEQVTAAAHTAMAALLTAGTSVICDDTNLPDRHVRQLQKIAANAGAGFEVMDLTSVPVEICVTRDAARGPAQVGSGVIRSMNALYLVGKLSPLPVPDYTAPAPGMVYEPPADAPPTILVDIDGTMALMNGRSPYEWERVGEDRPNMNVIRAVTAVGSAGTRVVFVSGRDEACRKATEQWLDIHYDYEYDALYMRPAGDRRPDTTVKAEIFEREIRHRYRVVGVFDDRNQVVRMWRTLGLTVFQVAEGNF